MPIGPAQMPLFDHLAELRRRLMVVVVTLFIASCGLWLVSDTLVFIIVHPVIYIIRPELTGQINDVASMKAAGILNLGDVFTGFGLRFKVSIVFALFVTSPVWIWQILGFFLPALKPNERKWVVPTFFAAITLFTAGAVFCYFFILPPAFDWLLGQVRDIATVLPFADSYVNSILLFEIGFGLAFELPLVVFYLTVFNIIPYKKLRKSWRVVYIVLMVVSAVITPDASPITMVLMFSALLVLYEGSLFVARLVLARRISKTPEATEEEG